MSYALKVLKWLPYILQTSSLGKRANMLICSKVLTEMYRVVTYKVYTLMPYAKGYNTPPLSYMFLP